MDTKLEAEILRMYGRIRFSQKHPKDQSENLEDDERSRSQ